MAQVKPKLTEEKRQARWAQIREFSRKVSEKLSKNSASWATTAKQLALRNSER